LKLPLEFYLLDKFIFEEIKNIYNSNFKETANQLKNSISKKKKQVIIEQRELGLNHQMKNITKDNNEINSNNFASYKLENDVNIMNFKSLSKYIIFIFTIINILFIFKKSAVLFSKLKRLKFFKLKLFNL